MSEEIQPRQDERLQRSTLRRQRQHPRPAVVPIETSPEIVNIIQSIQPGQVPDRAEGETQ